MATIKLRNMVKNEDPVVAGRKPFCDMSYGGDGNPDVVRGRDALVQQMSYALKTKRIGSFGSDLDLLRGEKIFEFAKPFGIFTAVSALVSLKKIQDDYLKDHPKHPLTEVLKVVNEVLVEQTGPLSVTVKVAGFSEADQQLDLGD